MGRMKDAEIRMVDAGVPREDVPLAWHLLHNLYPPQPEAFAAAREAIRLARAGEFDAECPYVHARDGSVIRVGDVIETLRLHDFLFVRAAEA